MGKIAKSSILIVILFIYVFSVNNGNCFLLLFFIL